MTSIVTPWLYQLCGDPLAVLAVHCGSIRQTATILSMDKDCLRTGDKATVHFRFIKTPEYLHIDQRLVFREGRTKAVGTITKVWPGSPPRPAPGSTRPRQLQTVSATGEALQSPPNCQGQKC